MMFSLRCARVATGVIAALALCTASALSQQPSGDRFKNQPLGDALRVLQARGLRIVFTSTIVTPDLRVRVEPRAKTARQQLDELLAPHGLQAIEGPGKIIQVVRATTRAEVQPSATSNGTIEGRVVDASTGGPLASILVDVEGANSSRTNEAGRFSVLNVASGTRILRVATDGYARFSRAVRVQPGRTSTVTLGLEPVYGNHTEHVTVTRSILQRQDHGVASEARLGRGEFDALRSVVSDDPLRAVHVLPTVWAANDFRSEFSVRGSPYRHVEMVVDGVATPWIQHSLPGRGAAGSLAMITSHALERTTLRAGAYPRRYGDHLGAELDVTLREGSRAGRQVRGSIGGSSATVVGEGPVGRSARGSWLLALRRSYVEWPVGRDDGNAFGFTDALAKVVYDVRPNEQITVSLLGGVSTVDELDDLGLNELGDGTNRTAVANLAWRATVGPNLLVSQRASLVVHDFRNRYQTGEEADRGSNEEVSYRADVARAMPGGVLEAGAHVRRIRGARQFTRAGGLVFARPEPSLNEGDAPVGERFEASSWLRSGFAHFAWSPMQGLTLTPGLRATDSTLEDRGAISPWVLGEWAFAPGWTLTTSAGVSHQFPQLHNVVGRTGPFDRRPERATHVDVGIEQRLADSVRWQATVFSREERDILRDPDMHPRLDGPDAGLGAPLINPSHPFDYVNALRGSARGIELLVERRSPTALSGWVAYSFGKARYSDLERHETFWADLDQRHAVNIFGIYRLSDRMSVAGTFRSGSNLPIPGYLAGRDGALFVGSERNRIRLPAYARLDLRADRAFFVQGRRVTFFLEVLNVLNRTNLGLASGSIRPSTGEAVGFTSELFPRLASAGIQIDF
jgi:TonB dependent receptor/Carboxypeptidase regulatory-like domain